MPTHRPQLGLLSQTELAQLTARAPRTIKRRLSDLEPVKRDGKTLWYDPPAALERIYLGESGDGPAQRARLDAARAELAELEIQKRRGELVPAGDLDASLIALATMTSSRLQAVPAAIAAELASEGEPAGCHAIVEREIHAALSDLAQAGREAEKRLAPAAA